MATLTGNAINTSYEGLLKTTDNAAISGTAKGITDGAGNAINMEIKTNQANLVSSFHLKDNIPLKMSTKSFRNTTTVLNAVAR